MLAIGREGIGFAIMTSMREFLAVPVVTVYTTALASLAMAVAFVNPKKAYGLAILWARLILRSFGVNVRLLGAEHLPKGPAIIMANHQSYLDVLALFDQLPVMLHFVAKMELAHIPVFGPAMRSLGHIFIDRRNHEQATRTLNEAAQNIRDGTTVVIFPEGTRSPEGQLLPFKKGGFVLALKAGVPIVPITITGSRECLPRGGVAIYPGEIRLRIHPPIDPSAYGMERKEALMQAVRAAIEEGLQQNNRDPN